MRTIPATNIRGMYSTGWALTPPEIPPFWRDRCSGFSILWNHDKNRVKLSPFIACTGRKPEIRPIATMKTIKDMPEHSRPREKLREKGASALTDEELVAAILGMGTAGVDVRTIARQVVGLIREHKVELKLDYLLAVPGIGLAKAAQILGLRVLDHVIVSRKGYYSFQEAGLIR